MKVRYYLLLLLLWGCTQEVQFTKTLPAEIRLPSGPLQLLFISRFDTGRVDFDDPGDVAVLKASYGELTGGLQKGFDTMAHIAFQPSDTLMRGAWYRFTDEMAFDDSLQLRQLQQQFPGYYLLTLDLFSLGLIPYDYIEYDANDFETRSYDVLAEAAFTLWDPQGLVVDQIITESVDVVRHRQIALGFRVVHPGIKAFEEKTKLLARDLGQKYAQLYIPIDVEVNRVYYNGKALNAAAGLMAQKQWEPARDLLLELTKHPNRKVAEKATYNLMVVYEALGDQQAIDFWQKQLEQ